MPIKLATMFTLQHFYLYHLLLVFMLESFLWWDCLQPIFCVEWQSIDGCPRSGHPPFAKDDNSSLFQVRESRANPLSLNRCELYMVSATRMKTKGHT